jgi:hypothetical protein
MATRPIDANRLMAKRPTVLNGARMTAAGLLNAMGSGL